MSDREQGFPIRSFRGVFKLERRFYRIDRWSLQVPGGVPLRGIGYFAAALAVVLVLRGLPVARQLLDVIPTLTQVIVLPGVAAWALHTLKLDGRSPHRAVAALCRHAVSPKRVAAFRPIEAAGAVARFDDVVLVPDERSARYRRARIVGPARVMVRYPAAGWRSRLGRRTAHIERTSEVPMFRGQLLEVQDGKRLVVEP